MTSHLKRAVWILFTTTILTTYSCLIKNANDTNLKNEGLVLKSGLDDSSYVELLKIKNNFWIHTSYGNFKGKRIPSNGLLAISNKEIILVDTPWNDAQTKELIKLVKDTFQKEITIAIITHAHNDRMGGINTLFKNKIEVRSIGLTQKMAEKEGYIGIQATLDKENQFTIDKVNIETFYPGEGHSKDNITVWFPESKILFGGCLIKSLEAKDMGNTADANVQEWQHSVKRVLDKYPHADVVIPGHGKWGNLDLIQHTIQLVKR